MLICLFLAGGLGAGPAAAGPWPRAPGGVFAALSREARSSADWDALYAEYGYSERMTFVLDAGRSSDGGWIAIVSARFALWSFGRHRFAASFGAGKEHVVFPGITEDADPALVDALGLMPGDYPMTQAGLSWGMGFDTRFGPGWATIDAVQRQAFVGNREEQKIDAAIGLSLRETRAIFAQAQYSDTLYDAPQIRLGLGWVEHFGPVAIEAGVGKRLRHGREADAKIGLWLTF